jgi:hypothetical protein
MAGVLTTGRQALGSGTGFCSRGFPVHQFVTAGLKWKIAAKPRGSTLLHHHSRKVFAPNEEPTRVFTVI